MKAADLFCLIPPLAIIVGVILAFADARRRCGYTDPMDDAHGDWPAAPDV